VFESSAPYVVTAMVSLISWILSSYYTEVRSVAYLKYEVIAEQQGVNSNSVRYRFTNVSPAAQIEGLNVSLVCPDDLACLGRRLGNQTEYARAYNVEPWSMETAPRPSSIAVSQEIRLPPDMSFEIICYLVDISKRPSVLFTKGSSASANVNIIRSQTFSLYFARNYLSLTLLFWICALLTLLGVYYNRNTSRGLKSEPTLVHLKLLDGIKTNEN
jgi:hypothetical protein